MTFHVGEFEKEGEPAASEILGNICLRLSRGNPGNFWKREAKSISPKTRWTLQFPHHYDALTDLFHFGSCSEGDDR